MMQSPLTSIILPVFLIVLANNKCWNSVLHLCSLREEYLPFYSFFLTMLALEILERIFHLEQGWKETHIYHKLFQQIHYWLVCWHLRYEGSRLCCLNHPENYVTIERIEIYNCIHKKSHLIILALTKIHIFYLHHSTGNLKLQPNAMPAIDLLCG